jgi:hypothetical protein
VLLALLGWGAAAPARLIRADDAGGSEISPPRLGYLAGDVGFGRPGAEWEPAQLNTPLAPGDLLDAGPDGHAELQLDDGAFLHLTGGRLALDRHDPATVDWRLESGQAALDLRDGLGGLTIRVRTPQGTVTVERPGYYRLSVTERGTAVLVHRGGPATLAAAGAAPVTVLAGMRAVARDGIETGPAGGPDAWDRWVLARGDQLVAAESARHLPPGMLGAADLDRHGTWRTVESYGLVWMPTYQPVGWVPYGAGRWLWDPRFGWTWVDAAPWGWAPFHYGRWVHLGRSWAWCPGPRVRPVYAPALVVFLGLGPARPVAWAPLGWGEPVVPWWGRRVGVPSWRGWGGPRVVNNVVVNNVTVVNARELTVYRNVAAGAVVGVPRERFARGPVAAARLRDPEVHGLAPAHEAPLALRIPGEERERRRAEDRRAPRPGRPGEPEGRRPEAPAAREPARPAAPAPRAVPGDRDEARRGAESGAPTPRAGRGPAERERRTDEPARSAESPRPPRDRDGDAASVPPWRRAPGRLEERDPRAGVPRGPAGPERRDDVRRDDPRASRGAEGGRLEPPAPAGPGREAPAERPGRADRPDTVRPGEMRRSAPRADEPPRAAPRRDESPALRPAEPGRPAPRSEAPPTGPPRTGEATRVVPRPADSPAPARPPEPARQPPRREDAPGPPPGPGRDAPRPAPPVARPLERPAAVERRPARHPGESDPSGLEGRPSRREGRERRGPGPPGRPH